MTEEKERYLRIISILYYVMGILTGLMACFPLFHLGFGVLMLVSPELAENQSEATMVGGLFIGIAVTAMILAVISALLFIATGRFIALRKHYTFCVVGAGISCLFAFWGMALGVITLILLLSPEVKALFDRPEDSWSY